MHGSGVRDLLAGTEELLADPESPGHSVVAEVNVGVWRMQPSLRLLQPLVFQLVQDILSPSVQT